MSNLPSQVVNLDEVEERDCTSGDHWGGIDKPLTPSMRPRGVSTKPRTWTANRVRRIFDLAPQND